MTSQVNSYRIYCVSESAYVQAWSVDSLTVCPNNNTHTVNPDSVQLLEKLERKSVNISNERIPTGGNYQFKNIYVDIPASSPGQVTTKLISFPFNMNLGQINYSTDASHVGDQISLAIAPNFTAGKISQDVLIGSTLIYVDLDVLSYIAVGHHVDLFDGVNDNFVGPCIAIDLVNKTITCLLPTTQAFLTSTPTFVRVSKIAMDNVFLGIPGTQRLGTDNLISMYMPANTPGYFNYKNNSGAAKSFLLNMQYWY